MKFSITFKTPDVVDQAFERASDELMDATGGGSPPEDDDGTWDDGWIGSRDCVRELISQYVEHGECVTIEFDTDDGSARVVPARKRG